MHEEKEAALETKSRHFEEQARAFGECKERAKRAEAQLRTLTKELVALRLKTLEDTQEERDYQKILGSPPASPRSGVLVPPHSPRSGIDMSMNAPRDMSVPDGISLTLPPPKATNTPGAKRSGSIEDGLKLQEVTQAYVQLENLVTMLITWIEGDREEVQLKSEFSEMVASEDNLERSVKTWANKMILKHPDGQQYQLYNFEEGVKTLNSYVVLLRVLVPNHLLERDTTIALKTPHAADKVQVISQLLDELSIPLPMKQQDLINGAALKSQHVLMLTHLLRLYITGDLHKLDWRDPPNPPADTQDAAKKITAKNAISLTSKVKFALHKAGKMQKIGNTALVRGTALAKQEESIVSSSEGTEHKRYMSLVEARLRNVLPSNPDARSKEHQDLEAVLKNNASLLKDIFKYYSVPTGVGTVEMDMTGFWRFFVHIKVRSAEVNRAAVGAIVLQSHHVAPKNTADEITGTKWIMPEEFVELLVRLGHLKFSSTVRGLKQLIKQHLKPYAMQAEMDDFFSLLQLERFVLTFQSLEKYLKDIYMSYARLDGQTRQEGVDMCGKEFAQIWTDAKLIDNRFTQTVVNQIFIHIQEDADEIMMYAEFKHALVMVAVYFMPAPFIPLNIRFRKFMTDILLPRLSPKFPNWNKAHLKALKNHT
jgi:hypothetical protein